MIVWVRHILFAIITSDLVLSFSCIFMFLVNKLFKKINPCLNLYMYKAAVLLTVVPILTPFLYLRRMHYENGVWTFRGNIIGGVPPSMSPIYIVLICVLIGGIAIYFMHSGLTWLKFKYAVRGNVPVDDKEWTDLADRYSSQYMVNKVEVLQNDLMDTPVTTGILRKQIITPYMQFDSQKKNMILEHEFYHIRNRHLIWKKLCNFAASIHVFNFAGRYLFNNLVFNQEVVCDLYVSNNNSSYTFAEYIMYIGQIDKDGQDSANDKDRRSIVMNPSTAACKGGKSFMANRLEKVINQRYYKKPSKIAIAICLSAMIIFSTVPAYAAAACISDFECDIKEKNIQSYEEEYVPFQNYLTEHEGYADGSANVIWVGGEDGIMPLSGAMNIDITVAPNDCMKYSPIDLKIYQEVTISVVAHNDNAVYRVGIEDYEYGYQHYVEGSGALTHVFVSPSTAKYCIFIENISGERTKVSGFAKW